MASKTALVLGAGVGGLSVAAQLRELLPDSHRVVLVDRSFEGVQGLSLLWVMRGWRRIDKVTLTPSGLDKRGIDVVEAEVNSISPGEANVGTSAGTIEFDALVLALGASLDSELLPGLPESLAKGSAGEFYTPDGAVGLHDKLSQLEGGRVCVLISKLPFKCPAAPYEGALLIADMLSERGVRDEVQLEVITPEPHPMPVAGPAVGQALAGILEEKGIGYRPNTPVERVDAGTDDVVLQSGERVPFDLLVSIPPHSAPRAVAEAGLGPQGWVPVDARTLRSSAPRVWAIGDAASITLPNGKPLPKAAVFARGEAAAVAAGVAREFGADAPEPWFDGEGYCYVEVGDGLAAKGAGNFLEAPAPSVQLAEPSKRFHKEKEKEERDWIAAWRN
ncbi:MAG: NAD(P)/FAD-dependent oxidoreductase [Actinomycetota bacterium]|nr:NAD(P)/FAD-dependent oxidoreductase [Actinomycetota bacterium]